MIFMSLLVSWYESLPLCFIWSLCTRVKLAMYVSVLKKKFHSFFFFWGFNFLMLNEIDYASPLI